MSTVILDLRDVGESVLSTVQDIQLVLKTKENNEIVQIQKFKHSKDLVENILSLLAYLSTLDYKKLDRHEELIDEVRKVEFSCFGLSSLLSHCLTNMSVYIEQKKEIQKFIKNIIKAANRIVTISFVAKQIHEYDNEYQAHDSGGVEVCNKNKEACDQQCSDGFCYMEENHKELQAESSCQRNTDTFTESECESCDSGGCGVCYKTKEDCEQTCSEGFCYEEENQDDYRTGSTCPRNTETFTESPLTHVENGNDKVENEYWHKPTTPINIEDIVREDMGSRWWRSEMNEILSDENLLNDNANEFENEIKHGKLLKEAVENVYKDEEIVLESTGSSETIDLHSPYEYESLAYHERFSNENEERTLDTSQKANLFERGNGEEYLLQEHGMEYNNNSTKNNDDVLTSNGTKVDTSDITHGDVPEKWDLLTDTITVIRSESSSSFDSKIEVEFKAHIEELTEHSETNKHLQYDTNTIEEATNYQTTTEPLETSTASQYDSSISEETPWNYNTPSTKSYEATTYSYATDEPTTVRYEPITYSYEATTYSYTTEEPTTPTYETTTEDLYKVSQDISSVAQDLSTKANEISSMTSDISSKVSDINSMVSDLSSYDDEELSKKVQSVNKITQEISSKTSEISSLCSTTSSLSSDISSASSDMTSAERNHRFRTSPWEKISSKGQDIITSTQAIITAAQDILVKIDNIVTISADMQVAEAIAAAGYEITAKTQLVISETLNIVSATIELINVVDT